MLLYLMRHGQAVSDLDDPLRPLSEEGRTEVEGMASFVRRNLSFLPGYIFCSPKLRARQTAEIVGSGLRNPLTPRQTEGLLPGDDPSIWAQQVGSFDRDLMLVGHMPHLGRLASLLLCWDPGKSLVRFSPAAVLCLSNQGGWMVTWALCPEALRRNA